MNHPAQALAREFAAALAWWQAAGVDCDFADDATAWLADPAAATAPAARIPGAARYDHRPVSAAGSPRDAPAASRPLPPPAAAPVPQRRDLLGDSPPADLTAFHAWWMSADTLKTSRSFPRIAPHGPAGARLMVLVPQPEEADRAQLLSGPQGRLLRQILAAMGIAADEAYCAAALPCHTPLADLAALAAGGIDAVTRHHIALAAPQRLLVLGTAVAAMLGKAADNGLWQDPATGRAVPVLVSETLEAMLQVPQLKARLWRRWLEWSATQ